MEELRYLAVLSAAILSTIASIISIIIWLLSDVIIIKKCNKYSVDVNIAKGYNVFLKDHKGETKWNK